MDKALTENEISGTNELVSNEDMRQQIPQWLIGLGGSLMFISIFVNSIGFNLMAVNAALTDQLIASIENEQIILPVNPLLLQRILVLERQIAELKHDSHPPTIKGK